MCIPNAVLYCLHVVHAVQVCVYLVLENPVLCTDSPHLATVPPQPGALYNDMTLSVKCLWILIG